MVRRLPKGVSYSFQQLVEEADPPCRHVEADIFYPDPDDAETIALAKEICSTCPIRQACLDYAFKTEDRHGIFGGTLPRERFAYLRKLKGREAA